MPLVASPPCPYAGGPQKLIETANRKDRFRLLDDSSVLAPDLDNAIHPIFARSNFPELGDAAYTNCSQALRLASMFIEPDSMLEWFVRPLFGTPVTDTASGKTFLTDPLAGGAPRAMCINGVRAALRCLAHSIQFRFVETTTFFGSTRLVPGLPPHMAECTGIFDASHAIEVRLRDYYGAFATHEHTACTPGDRLRFDFHLASVLVHELTHAVGMMRRGDHHETCLSQHDPQPEWGFAWEHFVFCGIVDPFDRWSVRPSFLLHKPWNAASMAAAPGSPKQWVVVPLAWVAQWFQRTTWAAIDLVGPAAVPPVPVFLKLVSACGRYTVVSDCPAALRDVVALQSALHLQCQHVNELLPLQFRVVLAAHTALLSPPNVTEKRLLYVEPAADQLQDPKRIKLGRRAPKPISLAFPMQDTGVQVF